MRIRSFLAIISLLLTSTVLSALPPYISADTFEKICRNVSCGLDFSSTYKSKYYPKQFHKAIAISTYKSGNRYVIEYGYFTYQYPTSSEAKSEALKGCRKQGQNCEIFLVNNTFANADLYYKLTNSSNSSSASYSSTSNIPANAYASSSDSKGWKCKTLYYENNNYCSKLPSNAIARTYGDGFYCKSGYEKSGQRCTKQTNIPANAHASGNSWLCNTDFYRSSNLKGCVRVPENAFSHSNSNYWYCNQGYTKNGNGCTKKITIPANAYASSSDSKGWKCKTLYYENNNYCSKLPSNAIARTYGDGFYCKSGYEKSGSSCIAKIKTEDAYQKAQTAYENKDYQTAFKEFLILAKTGNEKAQNYLGVMYAAGKGISKNLKQAVSWYRKAANQGYSTAQANLGYMYEKGRGVTQDYKLAVSWYRKAANQGNSRGQTNLGYMYRKGRGVTQDDKLAVSWYRKAANQGNSSAQGYLGYMYDKGHGVIQDDKLAVSWYRKAANQGNSTAQNNLGVKYENGNGVTKDYKLAVSWYRKAANQGNDFGQWNLGSMYKDGKGVAQNDKLALSWYRKAANQGHNQATKDLKALELKIKNKEDEAKTNIPPNAYASGDSWKCKSGYIKNGSFCELDVPDGAYASGSDGSWKCKYGYYKSGMSCIKIYVPANAYVYGSSWKCYTGYEKSGQRCVLKSNIPENSYASGDGWKCKSGYTKRDNFCRVNVQNGYWTYDGSTMKCYTGYRKIGTSCKKESNEILIDGNKYVGELRNGKPNGRGTMTYTDGDKYVGEWKDGERHGNGTQSSAKGSRFVSEWRNDEPYGQFTFTLIDGTIIVGDAKDELNFATITYPNGDKYTGELNDDGQMHGQGKMTYANGTTKEGVWKDDEFLYATNESKPKNNYSNDDELIPAASGTGFAVNSDGYVVTNNHVVKDCNNVEIYHKGRAIRAIVINVDPIIDLAIIKGNFRPEKFYYLSTKKPRLRMSVDVIGYGFGKKISSNVKATRGIISSLVGIENDSSRVQIDAAVQPGNSGGPIIDKYGNVVGVAVEKVHPDWAKENLSRLPENIAFGIKSGAVINFLDGNNIEYSIDNELSDEEIDTLIHGGTYYLSCLMTLSQIEKIQKQKVLFSDLN